MSPNNKVIVFGATGKVGSATAQAAHQQGAKVYLATRDTNKAIPGLENEGEFERVYADLSKPDTLKDALVSTGAKRAFLYFIHESTDGMRQAVEALKAAGLEFAVFLSSAGIKGDADTGNNKLAWANAQVEASLKDVFGTAGYVALRPGYFATNSLGWQSMIANNSEAKIPYAEAKFDWLDPRDIGAVAGAFLAGHPDSEAVKNKPSDSIVYLYGSKLISQRDAAGLIGRAVGKPIKITTLNEEEGVEFFVKTAKLPEEWARIMITVFKQAAEASEQGGTYDPSTFARGVDNVRRFAGREPKDFAQWIEENTQAFAG